MKILALLVLMTTTASNITAAPLPPCPSSPNCVSSLAVDSHHIEPFKITGDAGIAFGKLRKILAQRTDTTLVSADEVTIRVEFRTMLGFVDAAVNLFYVVKLIRAAKGLPTPIG